jgi:hypothetical protein
MNTLPHELRDAVRSRTEDAPVPPVPWPALRRSRRRRTTRTVATAAVLATAAAGAAAVLGVPGQLPGPDAGPVAPATGLPRGTLAGDAAWVTGMLRQAGRESMGTAEQVRYADDVAGTRVALVLHRNSATEQIAVWYVGPAGAAPERMDGVGGLAPDRVEAFVIPPTTADPKHSTVLALAAPGGRMSVWTNNDVDAGGSQVTGVTPGVEERPGVYTARLAVPFPQVDLRMTGLPGGDWRAPVHGANGFVSNPPRLTDAQWWARTAKDARAAGGSPPPGLSAQHVYDRLGLRSDVAGSRVLWVAPDDGTAVLALRAPSGGWAVVATGPQTLVEAVRLQPAAVPPGSLSLAWYDLRSASPDVGAAPTDDLRLLGPATATTARVTTSAGTPTDVPLDRGTATAPLPDATRVTFLDATGRELTTLEVTPAWPAEGPLNSQQ